MALIYRRVTSSVNAILVALLLLRAVRAAAINIQMLNITVKFLEMNYNNFQSILTTSLIFIDYIA